MNGIIVLPEQELDIDRSNILNSQLKRKACKGNSEDQFKRYLIIFLQDGIA